MGYFIKDQNFIGEINLDISLQEDRVGLVSVPKLSNLKIYVYGGEGKFPHMHIFNRSINFETCLMLYEPKYFIHGTKSDRFNKKQLVAIDNFLKTPYSDSPLSKWQVACMMWDASNNPSKPLFSMKNIQPDYTKTIESIH
jgi:hypothetical protein